MYIHMSRLHLACSRAFPPKKRYICMYICVCKRNPKQDPKTAPLALLCKQTMQSQNIRFCMYIHMRGWICVGTMEICRGTLQPKKPQEVPWKYAVVPCSQAPGGALCRGAPREAQRSPESLREAQRRTERPREAHVQREAQRGRAWIEQA